MRRLDQRRGILFVVSAPSGGGKTTLVRRALADDPSLELSVSCTTRPPRNGEVDGRDYHFVSRAEFEVRREQGAFVEWAEVFDHAYATPRLPLDAAIGEGRDVLLDVDVQGAHSLRQAYGGDAVAIFVVPPSRAALEERLRQRGTDAETQVRRRLERAAVEVAAASEPGIYDYLIVNDERDHAAGDLFAIIRAERLRLGRRRTVALD